MQGSCLIRAPGFWERDGVAAHLLAPLAAVTERLAARRVARPGWRAPVPVICCGNAGVGGSGKTPLALDLGARLLARGRSVAFLTRGYGGRRQAATRVDLRLHDAAAVGDEALLLAAVAITFVAADREAAARAAIAAGADILVMDDGLQNPGLFKDCALLAIDGGVGFGNGRTLPAGPLREAVGAAARRCRAAVLIGADDAEALAQLPHGLPVLRAELRPATEVAGRRLLAFAGIGRPGKFFATLRQAGALLAATRGFADHHRFSAGELDALRRDAAALDAGLVTTTKDFVRLPTTFRQGVFRFDVRLAWQAPEAVEAMLDTLT